MDAVSQATRKGREQVAMQLGSLVIQLKKLSVKNSDLPAFTQKKQAQFLYHACSSILNS